MSTAYLDPTGNGSSQDWQYPYGSSAWQSLVTTDRYPTVNSATSDYSNGYLYGYHDGSTSTFTIASEPTATTVSLLRLWWWGYNSAYASASEYVYVSFYIGGAWTTEQALQSNSSGGSDGTWQYVDFSGTWSGLSGVQLKFRYADPNHYQNGCSVYACYAEATYTAGPATHVLMTGPSAGSVGIASSDFTVSIDGTNAGVTVTPNDGGNGGTFSPTSILLPYNTPSGDIPTMTSATSPSGTVTSSSDNSTSYANWMAFDNSNTTFWVSSGNAPQWLQYQFPSAHTVKAYRLIDRNDGSYNNDAPRAWQLQGSNNGTSWTTVDTQAGQGTISQGGTREYKVASPGSYTYYRFYCTQANSGNVSLTQLQLFDSLIYPTFTYTAASPGVKTISVTNSDTLINPSSISYTAVYSLSIPNYSFESPTTTNYSYRQGGASWQFYKNAGLAIQSSFASNGSVPDGIQYALVQDSDATYASHVGQILSGLTVGTAYTVKVFSQFRSNTGSTNPFTTWVDNVPVGGTTTPTNAWVDYNVGTFYATATSQYLRFQGSRTGVDNTSLLDNVRITYQPTAAATAYTFSSPSLLMSGVGYQSGLFTVGLCGTNSGVTITPNDNSGGGTFTPSSVTLSSTTSPSSNLVTNGNAETGSTSGWTATNSPTVITYSSQSISALPLSDGGSYVFYGGTNQASSLTQTITLPQTSTQLDTGSVMFTMSAYIGGLGSDNDVATVSVYFKDASNSTVGVTTSIGPVANSERNNENRLFYKFAKSYVPATSRTAVITIKFIRGSSSGNNDGIVDNVTFATQYAPAEAYFTYTPSTVGLKTISVTNGGSLANPSSLLYYSSPLSGTAVLQGTDTTTSGTWRGSKGTDGYYYPSSYNTLYSSLPSYITTLSGYNYANLNNWTGSTSDTRALQQPAPSTDRVAGYWSTDSSFYFPIEIVGSTARDVSLYFLDWDNTSPGCRAIDWKVYDTNANAVLASGTVTSYYNGIWVKVRCTGNVLLVCSRSDSSCTNATMSGIFFDTPAAAATSVSVSGPNGGSVSVASTAFTLSLLPPSSTGTSSTVVTPSTDGTGTFSPTSVTLTDASRTATFTFTPTSVSNHRISFSSSNGSVAMPAPISYSATGTLASGSDTVNPNYDYSGYAIYDLQANVQAKAGSYDTSGPITYAVVYDVDPNYDYSGPVSITITGGSPPGTVDGKFFLVFM